MPSSTDMLLAVEGNSSIFSFVKSDLKVSKQFKISVANLFKDISLPGLYVDLTLLTKIN